MKKIILITLALIIFHSAFTQGLEGIVVEIFYVSDEADSLDADENFAVYPLHIGSVTYRVYADLQPGYKFIQTFGSPEHPMEIATTTSFYNDPNYGVSVYSGTSLNNTRKNTMLIDSYLTTGGVCVGKIGVLKSEDTDGTIGNNQGILANTSALAGLPIMGADGVDGLLPGTPVMPNTLGLSDALSVFDQTQGSLFYTTNGTVVALGGTEGVTPSNHVLVGQFTTDGILSFKLNVQILAPNGADEVYVAENPSGNEFSIPSLIYSSDIVSVQESKGQVKNDLVVYPNPAKDQILVHSSNFRNAPYVVFDITGQAVLNGSLGSEVNALDISNLANGVYVLQVENNGERFVKQFVKN